MSRLAKRFYASKCEVGTGPFGPEILTGAFLIARYPPKWLDILQVVQADGECVEISLGGWIDKQPIIIHFPSG